MDKKYLLGLIAEARKITEKAVEEKRALTAEERAKIEEITATVEAAQAMPKLSEDLQPENRGQQQQPGAEFRTAISTTGIAVLDGQKAEDFWKGVKNQVIIRQFASVRRGNGKVAIPVVGGGTFSAGSLPETTGITGKTLTAKSFRQKVPVKEELFNDAGFDIEGAIKDAAAGDWANTEDLEILQGSVGGTAGIFASIDPTRTVENATPTVAKLLEAITKIKARFIGGAMAFVSPAMHAVILQNLDTNKQLSQVGGIIYAGSVRVVPIDGLTVAHAIVGNPSQIAILNVNEIQTKKLVETGAENGEIIFLNTVRFDATLIDDGAFAAFIEPEA